MLRQRIGRSSITGMTLLELIIATGILMILASAAVPLARVAAKRNREAELHYQLRQMRDAIDRYKDAADAGKFRIEADTFGYPPDLDTLVKGVDITSVSATGVPAANPAGSPAAAGGNPAGVGTSSQVTMHVRFLRAIPTDPFTKQAEWNWQSVSDDPTSTSWGGKNVFNVHSKSTGTALDGTKYADW